MPIGYSLYRDAASPIHRSLDPRSKMLWLVCLFGIALCFNHPAVLGGVLVALGVVARVARLRWADIRGFTLLALWLVVLSVLLWPTYIHDGTVLFDAGFADYTDVGLLFGLAMGFRISIMVLAAGIWMLTTSPQRITAGLLAVSLPYKAGMALSSTIRFIPLMNAERATIVEAQRSRGLELAKGNPLRRARYVVPILVPLFSRAFLTAQSLTVAMDARGFGAGAHRTSIVRLRFTRTDAVVCAAAVLALAAALALRLLSVGTLIPGTL